MKSSDIDWSVLRGAIITLTVSLVLSAFMMGGGYYFHGAMQTEYDRSHSRFRSISTRYLDIDEEEDVIRKYYPQFVELYNRGIFGRERRLDWIEILRDSGDTIEIPSLRYEISSQAEYEQNLPINFGNFKLYASTMRITMDMLHEGDLLRLLQALDRMPSGLYTVTECTFSQRGPIVVDEVSRGNINSTCKLDWFNVKQSDGSDIGAS